MPVKDKIVNGSLTIRDVKPEITSEGLARSSGYSLMRYRDIAETMDTLESRFSEEELTGDPDRGISKFYVRLDKTRKELDNFIENYEAGQ